MILFASFCLKVSGSEAKTNVILMLADDLGYNDLACYGSKSHKTPVLDKLAEEGLRLTNFYAGATVCTPVSYTHLTLPTNREV